MRTLSIVALLVPLLRAQYAPAPDGSAPAPDAYSLTGVNGMFGPNVSMKLWRDGQRAVLESSAPKVHTMSLFDLQAHSVLTWVPGDATVPCTKGTFGGDWGDPFALSAELNSQVAAQHGRQTGTEAVNGIAAKVMEAASPDGSSAKAWI